MLYVVIIYIILHLLVFINHYCKYKFFDYQFGYDIIKHMFSERQVSILTSNKDDNNNNNISDSTDDSQKSEVGDSNIDDFFAQFDKISNKFETKTLEDSIKSNLEGKSAIGSSK